MLYDIERKIKQTEKDVKSDSYKELLYDLESYIIELSYAADNCECDAERQAYIGKKELVNKVLDESESIKVHSRIRPILLKLGLREGNKGFRLLEACVLEASRQTVECGGYRMKDVYPVVAKQFNITAHNCERLCRYACDEAEPNKDFARSHPYFEELTHRTYEKVTVKELMDILVAYALAKCNVRDRGLSKV